MFLNISKKLQVLLRGIMINSDLYLVIYSDDNWAILNYWDHDAGVFSFNPQEESPHLYDTIALIIQRGKV